MLRSKHGFLKTPSSGRIHRLLFICHRVFPHSPLPYRSHSHRTLVGTSGQVRGKLDLANPRSIEKCKHIGMVQWTKHTGRTQAKPRLQHGLKTTPMAILSMLVVTPREICREFGWIWMSWSGVLLKDGDKLWLLTQKGPVGLDSKWATCNFTLREG